MQAYSSLGHKRRAQPSRRCVPNFKNSMETRSRLPKHARWITVASCHRHIVHLLCMEITQGESKIGYVSPSGRSPLPFPETWDWECLKFLSVQKGRLHFLLWDSDTTMDSISESMCNTTSFPLASHDGDRVKRFHQ